MTPLAAYALPHGWTEYQLEGGGRTDAVVDLGNGVIACGTRQSGRDGVYLSRDYGETWTLMARPFSTNITCLAGNRPDHFFALTGIGEVWKTENEGRNWKRVTVLPIPEYRKGNRKAYGLHLTPAGTLLASDTAPDGGHVHRSTDNGETWEDLGPVGKGSLYRFQQAGDAILVNTFDGAVYGSDDDGRTWALRAKLSEHPVHATEYLGNGVVLQGDRIGKIFRSEDFGRTWKEISRIGGACDDFAFGGGERLIASTFSKGNHIFSSEDGGKTWVSLGPPNADDEQEWFDHFIGVPLPDGGHVVLGGTYRGKILRTVLPPAPVK